MKNRNLILSVLLWVISSTMFAVTLPSTSYQSSLIGEDASSENIVIGSGARYTQVYLTSSADWGNACWEESQGYEKDCLACCKEKLYDCTSGDCLTLNEACVGVCHNGPSLPLGSPLLLLPFIAVYAVIRNRKNQK